MSKKEAMPPCPYCTDPDLFDKRLAPTDADQYDETLVPRRGSHWPEPHKLKIPAIARNKKIKIAQWGIDDPADKVTLKTPEAIRGKIRVRTITDADMVARFAGFQIQVIAVETRTEPPMPSGVFLGRLSRQTTKGWFYYSFNAARITHKDSAIIIDSHWHPSHGRILTMRGFGRVAATAEERKIIDLALSFDTKPKRRGAPPKVDTEVVIKAIREQGEKATQKSVAAATGIARNTLQNWLYFRACMTWDLLKRKVMEGESIAA